MSQFFVDSNFFTYLHELGMSVRKTKCDAEFDVDMLDAATRRRNNAEVMATYVAKYARVLIEAKHHESAATATGKMRARERKHFAVRELAEFAQTSNYIARTWVLAKMPAPDGKRHKVLIPRGVVKEILEEHGLSFDEFLDHLDGWKQ